MTRLLLPLLLALAGRRVRAHPLCLNYEPPFQWGAARPPYQFCTAINGNPDGACCSAADEAAVQERYNAIVAAAVAPLTAPCQNMLEQLACGRCHPWAAHLFQSLGPTLGNDDGMQLCTGFCTQFVTACGPSLGLDASFCTARSVTPDPFYCYPFDANAAKSLGAVMVQEAKGPPLKPAFPLLVGKLPQRMTALVLRPDVNAWWAVDHAGTVWEIQNDPAAKTIALVVDLTSRVLYGGEMGLVGLAFHPNFAATRAFYVTYVAPGQAMHVSRITFGDTPAETVASEVVMMAFQLPQSNHHAGWLGFPHADFAEPDRGYHDLYISTGDGGGANDDHGPIGNAQDLGSYLGKVLRVRITAVQAVAPYGGGAAASAAAATQATNQAMAAADMEAAAAGRAAAPAALAAVPTLYSIPADNPFADTPGALGEVYAYGLRNPWRCSFDRATDDLWCADVGQDSVEEVNVIEAGTNYGWRAFEGMRCNQFVGAPPNLCTIQGTVGPIYQYCHPEFKALPPLAEKATAAKICGGRKEITGRSITGGYIYRGAQWPALVGQYIFADFEVLLVAAAKPNAVTGVWEGRPLATAGNGLGHAGSFAEDADGELLIVSYDPPNILQLPCFGC